MTTPIDPPPLALSVIEAQGLAGYRLLDSGSGRKLEQFGSILVDRPEPQALWRTRLEAKRWQAAHAVFSGDGDDEAGKWRVDKPVPETWPVPVTGKGLPADVSVLARLSAFRHLGLFPEQAPHWAWMVAAIERVRSQIGGETPRVLNLFGYTGAASLIAAKAGAEVVHVDASKKAIAWARENQAHAKLSDAPVRWILDDARKFAARDVRRGRTYHVILVDPPKFGRGPGGEVWELFDHLPALLADCVALLDPRAAHLVLTSYAIRASSLAIGQLTHEMLGAREGRLEIGELAIREEAGQKADQDALGPRALPTSLFARWSGGHAER